MAYRIPENTIPKLIQYTSSNIGDFKTTFNIDLAKKLGSITATRMIQGASFDDVVTAFHYFDNAYFAIGSGHLRKGGDAPSDVFSNVTGSDHPNNINPLAADLEEFNNFLYVAGSGNGDGIHKYSGSAWTIVSASGLSSSTRMHLMKAFADKLYIIDGVIVKHITTGDALVSTGTATFDPNLSNSWVCTMLEASFDSLFIGYHNIQTGKGLIFEWDGSTENQALRKYELQSGILGGTVLDGIPYYMDTRGTLMGYAGTSFQAVGSIGTDTDYAFYGVDDQTVEDRPMHPNGITSTEDGTIIILWNNRLAPATNQGEWDTKPAGIYEYHPEIGMYHKYSIAQDEGYGDFRMKRVGALMQRRPTTGIDNGTIIAGASQFQGSDIDDTLSFVFYDDVLNEQTKTGYFITKDIWSSNIDDTWQNVYLKFKKLLNINDIIEVSYRTNPHTATVVDCSWTDEQRLLTSENLSQYSQGDEVTILTGKGAGKIARIKDIKPLGAGYSVLLDREFTGATGTSNVSFDKWIFAGKVEYGFANQLLQGTVSKNNVSPYIEFKVYLEMNGNHEVYSLYITNTSNQKK